jgi:hypothetical protein
VSSPAPATKISSLLVPVSVLAFSLPKWSMAYLELPPNTLKLNLNDLLDASTSTNILKVLGNSGDTVNTSGFVKTKIETENGITYDIYTHSDANIDAKAALWVQQGVSMKDMQREQSPLKGCLH